MRTAIIVIVSHAFVAQAPARELRATGPIDGRAESLVDRLVDRELLRRADRGRRGVRGTFDETTSGKEATMTAAAPLNLANPVSVGVARPAGSFDQVAAEFGLKDLDDIEKDLFRNTAQIQGTQIPEEEEYCDHVHHSDRAPWLRAFILGANDGLVSVAALLMGVEAGTGSMGVLRLSAMASWVAGALSMAAGEYVSVASQRDAEQADVEKEEIEQRKGPEAQARELEELTDIYVRRGLDKHLARQVAECLTKKDVIRAHARDELGIDIDNTANPRQAAAVSALAFTVGALIPMLSSFFISSHVGRLIAVLSSSTCGLVLFGVLGAHLGGAGIVKGGLRVLIGGWIALFASFGIGHAFSQNFSA